MHAGARKLVRDRGGGRGIFVNCCRGVPGGNWAGDGICFLPPPIGRVGDLSDVAPGAVAGTVQVDPGDQPVPGFAIQLDAVMPLLQHLNQFAGVGMILAGPQQRDAVLDVHAADERDQCLVGRRVDAFVSSP